VSGGRADPVSVSRQALIQATRPALSHLKYVAAPANLFNKANRVIKLTMPNQPGADIDRVQANSRAAPAQNELR
jgi:hypothetical protein